MIHDLTSAYYDNANAIYDFWIANGLTPAQACGMVANADAECSLNPTLVGDKGKAFGLHQWHMDRVAMIRDGGQGYKGCGVDVSKQTDLSSQLKAALWELTHSEHHAFALIKATTTPETAGCMVCIAYERSGLADQPAKRAAKAASWSTYFSSPAS